MRLILTILAVLVMPFLNHRLEPLFFVVTGIIAAVVMISFVMETLHAGKQKDDTYFPTSKTQHG